MRPTVNEAQRLAFPQSVMGSFHADANVDVFAMELSEATPIRVKVIAATLPAGRYFITRQDAHDRGGPAHPYRLIVSEID